MNLDRQATVWLSAGGLGLLVLAIGVFLWFDTPRSIPPELPDIPPTANLIESPTLTAPTVDDSPPVTLDSTPLPLIDYPPGSIGHECGVNEFPPRVGFGGKNPLLALMNEECYTAVERHVNLINPYLWGNESEVEPYGGHRAIPFVVVDNPVTFERIFTDPAGDFALVQEALARPECQLTQDAESNWNLNEMCHADSILNYALIMQFCYSDGVHRRISRYYSKKDNPTPEQDRSMWIQELEDAWVRKKCKTLDPILDLQAPVHTELRKQILALEVNDYEDYEFGFKSLDAALIELAARLGDDTAGLTHYIQVGWDSHTGEQGYKYGRFANWFTNMFNPTHIFTKHPPSVERLYEVLPLFSNNLVAGGGRLMTLDHEALVQHLCTPPFFTNPYTNKDPVPEPPSCREIIAELHQEFHDDQTFLGLLATFEDVAMRLDVYE